MPEGKGYSSKKTVRIGKRKTFKKKPNKKKDPIHKLMKKIKPRKTFKKGGKKK